MSRNPSRVRAWLRGWLWLAAALAGSVPASAQMSCTASASAVSVRSASATDRVSDIVLTCSGGTPTGVGQTVPSVIIQLFFNTNVTSRVMAQGWSEALLVVDEPGVSNQLMCATANGICSMSGTGNGATTYNGTPGRFNVFQGATNGNNGLVWSGVPFDPLPAGGPPRRFRITNLRAAANALGAGASVVSQVSIIQAPVNNPQQTVAQVQQAITVSEGSTQVSGGGLSAFSVNVAENLTNALRSRSSAGPGASAQSQPNGVPFDSETGFYNPNLVGNANRGNASLIGLPDSGTRVRFRFTSIPAGATFSAPLLVNFGQSRAQLVVAAADGSGQYTPAASTTLVNTNGTVLAVYEIVQATTATETLQVPFSIGYGNGVAPLTSVDGDVSLAPVNATTTASLTAPIPRFNEALPLHIGPPLNIETQTLPNGVVGAAYSQAIVASGGSTPYAYFFAGGTLPPGVTLSNGVVVGTPTTVGTFNFTVRAVDAQQAVDTQNLSLTIVQAGVPFTPSISKLDFTAIEGGAPPPPKVVGMIAAQSSQTFRVRVEGATANSPAPNWIQVTPDSGSVPILLMVKVDQGSLPVGSYSARILVSTPDVQGLPNLEIPVTLTVQAQPAPMLDALPKILRFTMRQADPGKRFGFILLKNTGGGGPIRFAAVVRRQSTWITGVTPTNGMAGSKTPVTARITVDSTGLAAGIYRDEIRFTWDGGTLDIPVVLRVAPNGPIMTLNRRGVRFSMQQGVSPPQMRLVQISNLVPQGSLTWNAEVIRGNEWFGLAANSGTASQATPDNLKIGLKPAVMSLAAGNYYGLVRVLSPTALNSPQYLMAVLQVRSATAPPDVDIDPGGLVLTTSQGSQQTVRGTVTVTTNTQTGVAFTASANSATGWLSVSPTTGMVTTASPATLTIAASVGAESPGIYFGEVAVATPTGTQSIAVAMVVSPSGQLAAPIRAATCAPDKATVASTGLVNNFSVPAGWPSALSVQVRDNCGTALSNATVVASFTNGDPPLTLDPDDAATGVYSATWQPGNASSQMNVTISAFTADFAEAKFALAGGIAANQAPGIDPGGAVDPWDPVLGELLTPGMPVAVYGHGLASAASSTVVPLPKEYNGTSAYVGPFEVPLYYVSPSLVNMQFPSELTPDRVYPVVIIANGAISMPELVDVVSVQPVVLGFLDHSIVAQNALKGSVLVDAQHPAQPGDFLVIYVIGMGATNPVVPTGQPTPFTAPLSVPNVTPTLTIDGNTVPIAFAGMTPTAIGLFQINFQIPANVRLNTPLEVVVKQGNASSRVVTLTVVP